MNERIVESVTGNELAFQFIATVSQSGFIFYTGAAAVEVLLVTAIGWRLSVGNTRIIEQVEALHQGRVDASRTGNPVEGIYNQYGSLASFGFAG